MSRMWDDWKKFMSMKLELEKLSQKLNDDYFDFPAYDERQWQKVYSPTLIYKLDQKYKEIKGLINLYYSDRPKFNSEVKRLELGKYRWGTHFAQYLHELD